MDPLGWPMMAGAASGFFQKREHSLAPYGEKEGHWNMWCTIEWTSWDHISMDVHSEETQFFTSSAPGWGFAAVGCFGYVSRHTCGFEVCFVLLQFGEKPCDSLSCLWLLFVVVDLFSLSAFGGVLLTLSLCSNGLWETDSKYRSEPLNLVYTASKRQSCRLVQPDLESLLTFIDTLNSIIIYFIGLSLGAWILTHVWTQQWYQISFMVYH